jgi:hypothetical protein
MQPKALFVAGVGVILTFVVLAASAAILPAIVAGAGSVDLESATTVETVRVALLCLVFGLMRFGVAVRAQQTKSLGVSGNLIHRCVSTCTPLRLFRGIAMMEVQRSLAAIVAAGFAGASEASNQLWPKPLPGTHR